MIFKKEFKSFFSNITGYIVIALFVLVVGFREELFEGEIRICFSEIDGFEGWILERQVDKGIELTERE